MREEADVIHEFRQAILRLLGKAVARDGALPGAAHARWPSPGWTGPGVRAGQDYFMGSRAVDYAQTMDIDRLVDYGPLDTALRNIGGG